jgi:hypothetical protein
MSVPSWHLSVKRAEFAKALRSVGRAGKDVCSATAVLTFDQSRLSIDLAGTVSQIPASGDWPSEVRLPGVYLERLVRILPKEDPVPLRVEADRLFVAKFSIPCECSLSGAVSTPVRELIPANADLFDILMMAARCSQEEIEAAGASALVSKAQLKLDELCMKAARALGGYGVSPVHLWQLCEEHLAEGDRHFRESDVKAIAQIAKAWAILAPMGVDPMEIKALMDYCLRNAWR